MPRSESNAESGQRVAIVGDEHRIRALLEVRLQRAGFLTGFAGDGGRGLGLIRDWRPDAVLLDVSDGLRILPLIREISSSPVIMLGGDGSPREGVRAFDLGAADFVAHRFSVAELVARTRATLRRARVRGSSGAGPGVSLF